MLTTSDIKEAILLIKTDAISIANKRHLRTDSSTLYLILHKVWQKTSPASALTTLLQMAVPNLRKQTLQKSNKCYSHLHIPVFLNMMLKCTSGFHLFISRT